jgi:hypothetical protein
MRSSVTALNLAALPIILGAFLLPGYLLARRLRDFPVVLGSFLASAAIFFNLILLIDFLRLPLEVGTIAIGLAFVSLALLWRRPVSPRFSRPLSPCAIRPALTGAGVLWLIAIVLVGLSLGIRATIDPLSGYDNVFRWDYLSRLMLAQHSLAGFPPVTAVDFEKYAWCDGIPPLVSMLNFWIYAVTRNAAPALTAVRVIGEWLLIAGGIAAITRQLRGSAMSLPAIAVASASSLLIWSTAIGQESGVMTVAVLGFVFALNEASTTPGVRKMVWAGIAAGVCALTREYGLAVVLYGLIVLLVARKTRCHVWTYLLVVTIIAAPWYLRNWATTGNPVYPQSLGGLFPTNPVHETYMRGIANEWSFTTSPYPARQIPGWLIVIAGLPVILGTLGAIRGGRRAMIAVGAIGLMIVLWLWSVPQTAGGWIYSSRVLAPALALGGALAGVLIEDLSKRSRVALAVVTIALAADAACRSWYLPTASLATFCDASFQPWRDQRALVDRLGNKDVWRVLAQAAGNEGIIVDHPNHHVEVVLSGGRAVPLVSPALQFTLGDNEAFVPTLAKLRAEHIRFVTLSVDDPMTRAFIRANPFWTALANRPPTIQRRYLKIYDLSIASQTSSTPSAPREPIAAPFRERQNADFIAARVIPASSHAVP